MNNITKVIIAGLVLFGIYAAFVLAPSDELGSFEKIRAGGEINQSINVKVDKTMGFEKDRNGNIFVFYARDKNNEQAKIRLNEPAPAELANAEFVEILGHMHGTNFVAIRVSKIN